MGLSDVIDIEDLKKLPSEFAATFKPSNMIAKGYPWWTASGDTAAFLTLFFDNLATQLTMVGFAVGGFGVGAYTKEFIFSHFMGGVGVSLLIGNLYYALQASKVAMQTGKMDTCAQPYGINTPGAIAKTFGILVPGMYIALAKQGTGLFVNGHMDDIDPKVLEAAMVEGWSIACCANFIGGLVEFVGAFVAPFIYRNIPYSAILVPIGGVGITWLGYGPIISILGSHQAHFPIVGFIPMLLIFISFFGTPRLFGPVPAVAVACIVGIILFAIVNASGYGAAFEPAVALVGKGGFSTPDFAYFSEITPHVGLVFGLACTSFIGTFSCNIAAKLKGDVYSPMESMMVDGIGSMIGALLGSPYGTTVYIGHGTYKNFGGTRGYSALNGILFFIFGASGLHALADAILPHEIILGVLVCIGFYIAAMTLEETPKRWYPAVIIGLCLCFSDYMATMGAGNPDIKIFQSGYIFVSCLYTFVLEMLIDRWFWSAGWIFVIMMLLTTCGVMHSGALALVYTPQGHHIAAPADTTYTYKIISTYGLSAVLMLLLFGLQKKGLVQAPEESNFRELQAAIASSGGSTETKKDVESAAA